MSEANAFLDGLRGLSRQQWALRAGIMVTPVVAFAFEVAAGAATRAWVAVLLAVLVTLSAGLPDSHAPLAVVLLLGGYWAAEVGENLGVSLLAVTVSVVTFHVLCLLASYGPPSVVLDAPLLRLWLSRAAVALATAGLVWLAAHVATGLDLPPSGGVFAAALLVVVGWVALLGRRLAVGPR